MPFSRQQIAYDTNGIATGVFNADGSVTLLSGGATILPSGDATGVTDLAAIQAALTSTGRVTLKPGGLYYVNTPITLPTRAHLNATGATVTLIAGVAGNVIRTQSVIPARTATDGYFIGGTAVNKNYSMTSLTMNFTSADIGSTVAFTGAGSSGATWYSVITAVFSPATVPAWTTGSKGQNTAYVRPTTANGLMYQASVGGASGATEPVWPTTFGATVVDGAVTWTCLGASTGATVPTNGLVNVTGTGAIAIFPLSARCKDITVQGGRWVITDPLLGGHNSSATFANSFASAFRRCDGLRILNTTWNSTGTGGTGGKYTVSIADCNQVTVEGTYFEQTGGDGVHINGPASYVYVNNTKGTTGDDFTVANTQDGYGPTIIDAEGSLAYLNFVNAMPLNCLSGFRLYEGTTANRFTVVGVNVENYSGTTQNQMISIDSTAPASDVHIFNIEGGPTTANTPLINVADSNANGLTIENVRWTGTNPAAQGIIKLAAPRGAVRISNVRFNSAPAGTNIGVYVTGQLNGNGFGAPCIDLDGFYTGSVATASAFPSPANATALYLAAVSGVGDTTFSIRNVRMPVTTGYIFQKLTAANISRINISDSSCTGSGVVALPAGDTVATVVSLDNVTGPTAASLVTSSSPIVVELNGVDVVTSAAMVALSGAGATPAVIKVVNSSQAGTGALVSRDGTQAIRVRGTDIPVDQTLLTPADGDMIYNSNATPGNGAGAALFNAVAGKWKNLYSGLTN